MTNCNTSEAKSEESSLTICASPTASFADESSATTRDQAWRSRVLYCRKCDGHGKQVALKGHAPKCPYNLCECQSCSKLMTKRLHSFKKRNKSRLEAAAILTAQKKAQLAALELKRFSADSSSNLDAGIEFGSMSNVSQASTSTSSSDDHRRNQTLHRGPLRFGLEAGTKPMTVMSYKIWKEQCASGKNAALQTKAHIDEADQRSCKRLLDRPNRKESSSSKPYSRSPPVLSRPHSSANVDWPLVTSSCSKHGTENRFTNEEYCRVTLPTIPPMTVLIRRDGSPIASSIAPLQPTITSEQLAFTSSQNQTPSEPSSTPNAAVSTSASPLLRTPIAVNHMPSCDVRMSTASTEDGVVSALSAALHPSNDVFSSIIHRPSPSMPNSQNLLKLPLNMVTSHSTIASQPSAVASAIDNQVDALATLSFRVPQPNAIRDGLTQALQNEALTRFLPAALSSQSNPALLAQQQQQQQRAAQQILSNTSVGNLIGTAPLQTAPELFNTAAANTSSGGGLIPALAASGTLPVPNVDEAAASLLRQLHQQQQLQQRIENANLLTSSDLLKVYQMLSDPIASQALQAQLKQLEHSGLLLGQSIAT